MEGRNVKGRRGVEEWYRKRKREKEENNGREERGEREE